MQDDKMREKIEEKVLLNMSRLNISVTDNGGGTESATLVVLAWAGASRVYPLPGY